MHWSGFVLIGVILLYPVILLFGAFAVTMLQNQRDKSLEESQYRIEEKIILVTDRFKLRRIDRLLFAGPLLFLLLAIVLGYYSGPFLGCSSAMIGMFTIIFGLRYRRQLQSWKNIASVEIRPSCLVVNRKFGDAETIYFANLEEVRWCKPYRSLPFIGIKVKAPQVISHENMALDGTFGTLAYIRKSYGIDYVIPDIFSYSDIDVHALLKSRFDAYQNS